MVGVHGLGGKVARPLVVALVVTLVGTVLVGVLGSGLGIGGRTSSRSMNDMIVVSRALATPVFVAAGALRLSRWHITGEPSCGLRGIGLLLMGGVSLPSLTLARSLSTSGGATAITCVRTLSVAAVLYVMVVALSEDVPHWRNLWRRGGLLATAAATMTLLLLLERERLLSGVSLQALVVPTLAFAWLALAVRMVAQSRQARWANHTAPLLAAMGIAELCRLPGRPLTTVVAASITAAVAFTVAASALVDLVRAADAERAAAEDLTRELTHVRTEISGRDAWRADLAHDARGALAGIRAAITTLERHPEDLDPAAADRLRHATLAELTHLEHMLEPRDAGENVFDVLDVVRTVTDVRRADGLPVEVALRSALVRGVPGDLATVLQNLLVNAQQHAPGASVRVEVENDRTHARVLVQDDGPGIPPTAASSAFGRGSRGPHSHGSGLGLSIARTLARRHGGEVDLLPSVCGTTFVVTWPLAARETVIAPEFEAALS